MRARKTSIRCCIFGHRFTWDCKVDKDGFKCARCGRLIRSETGRMAKDFKKAFGVNAGKSE